MLHTLQQQANINFYTVQELHCTDSSFIFKIQRAHLLCCELLCNDFLWLKSRVFKSLKVILQTNFWTRIKMTLTSNFFYHQIIRISWVNADVTQSTHTSPWPTRTQFLHCTIYTDPLNNEFSCCNSANGMVGGQQERYSKICLA